MTDLPQYALETAQKARAASRALVTISGQQKNAWLTRAAEMADYWADAVHSLKGLPHVIDLRNLGLMGAIELQSRPGAVGARAFEAHVKAFFDENLMVRYTGDIIAFSPPLIITKAQIDEIFGRLRRVLETIE